MYHSGVTLVGGGVIHSPYFLLNFAVNQKLFKKTGGKTLENTGSGLYSENEDLGFLKREYNFQSSAFG